MADQNAVRAAAEPVLSSLGLELVDIEVVGSGRARTLRLTVDRDGGIDLDTLAEANRPVLDALDAVEALTGPYTLELSSPGLERPLRRPAEFQRFVGSVITGKTKPSVEGDRRFSGELTEADDDGIVVGGRRLAYDDIDTARTVFEWGPTPKPGQPKARTRKATTS